jgi:hypothetical protein
MLPLSLIVKGAEKSFEQQDAAIESQKANDAFNLTAEIPDGWDEGDGGDDEGDSTERTLAALQALNRTLRGTAA